MKTYGFQLTEIDWHCCGAPNRKLDGLPESLKVYITEYAIDHMEIGGYRHEVARVIAENPATVFDEEDEEKEQIMEGIRYEIYQRVVENFGPVMGYKLDCLGPVERPEGAVEMEVL